MSTIPAEQGGDVLCQKQLLRDSHETIIQVGTAATMDSCDCVEQRWKEWFQRAPKMKDPIGGKSDATMAFMRTIIPFEWQNTEKERLLLIAFNPTKNELLNIAQVHMLSVFADFLETDNDAVALQMLLHNRLVCFLSDDRDMCIQHPEYAGDFFRLLLMYFNPTFAFLLDQHYPSWEDEMGSLLLDPTSCFTPTQLLIILESLQGVEIQSTLWLMLWFVDVISLHHDSRHATSFQVPPHSSSHPQQFLRDATSSSAAVSLLSVAQLLQRLPAASQDFIVCSACCLEGRAIASHASHNPLRHRSHPKHPKSPPSLSSLASPTFASSSLFSVDRRPGAHDGGSPQGHDPYRHGAVQGLPCAGRPQGGGGAQRVRERGERVCGGGAVLVPVGEPEHAAAVQARGIQLGTRRGVSV